MNILKKNQFIFKIIWDLKFRNLNSSLLIYKYYIYRNRFKGLKPFSVYFFVTTTISRFLDLHTPYSFNLRIDNLIDKSIKISFLYATGSFGIFPNKLLLSILSLKNKLLNLK